MNKKELFKSYSLACGTVDVPSWSEEPVRIQELSAGAIDKMRGLGEGKELKAAVLAVIYGVINEEGRRVFADNDINSLMEMSVNDLNKVSEAVLRVSGLGVDSGEQET